MSHNKGIIGIGKYSDHRCEFINKFNTIFNQQIHIELNSYNSRGNEDMLFVTNHDEFTEYIKLKKAKCPFCGERLNYE